MIKIKQLLLMGLVGLMMVPTVSVSAESEDLIKYRRGVMKAVGGHMSAVSLIVRGKVPHKDQLKAHVNALKILTHDIPALFPEDSDFGETAAKEEVWDKPKEFSKAAKSASQSIVKLLSVIDAGKDKEIMASFREVGKACKGCHKTFREKDQ